jgi:hypothetical protein
MATAGVSFKRARASIMSILANAKHYRAKSEEAERNAAAAKNPTAKKQFARIAEHWRAMAQDAEQRALLEP